MTDIGLVAITIVPILMFLVAILYGAKKYP